MKDVRPPTTSAHTLTSDTPLRNLDGPELPVSALSLDSLRYSMPVNAWSQTIESKELPGPTSADFSAVPTVRSLYFFPYTKLLNETDGYFYENTMYLEISFFDPPIPTTQSSLFLPFPFQIFFNTLSVG